jgi:hypothetical protein
MSLHLARFALSPTKLPGCRRQNQIALPGSADDEGVEKDSDRDRGGDRTSASSGGTGDS